MLEGVKLPTLMVMLGWKTLSRMMVVSLPLLKQVSLKEHQLKNLKYRIAEVRAL